MEAEKALIVTDYTVVYSVNIIENSYCICVSQPLKG